LGNTIDFTNPVDFEIQAEDGTTANWQVKVTQLAFSGLDVVRLYPMPAFNTLNVAFKIPLEAESSVTFSSIQGVKLFSKTVSTDGYSPFDIDVSEYPEGAYLLTVINGGHTYTKKVIIKH
jgi:hypothetical protein